MVIHCTEKFDEEDLKNAKYVEYFNWFPYPLSDFQKWAIYAVVNGDHTLITAHTGSGKTLPAEFAIQFFKERNKKVIYTAPIKALCNQKLYDLRLKYPHISFGILTGDVKDNPEADVIIMTTEILRNTLFTKKINEPNETNWRNPGYPTTERAEEMAPGESVCQEGVAKINLQFEMDMDTELGAVVFDEVHYIGDQDRGSVWEQAILLLPPQVQLIMLSATIEKPEIFADWVESEKNKHLQTDKPVKKRSLYLTTTYERVVPLTHYGWITAHQSVIQSEKATPYKEKFAEVLNKPIKLADTHGKFNDINYYKLRDILSHFKKNHTYIKRPFVLNTLVKHLLNNNMLPAICFVFSRKNVELCAKEITINLFDKDDKTPSIIENECEKILICKLRNYKEYMQLEEYQTMIKLLRNGIAVHHAGILPILKEMVELLFEKKYIKLLFATETFAVGINMPTKTVVFTGLSKFSGTGMRYLLPHEYTQMAGRAGRRGIDTVGHVIHCNNLFSMPDMPNEYRNMLTGSPKMLTSQFKVSFNLILSIISANSNNLERAIDNTIITFMEKSFMQTDIVKEINQYDICEKALEEKVRIAKTELNDPLTCKTPIDILDIYIETKNKMESVSNKQKKKMVRDLTNIESENINIKNDIKKYETLEKLKMELMKNNEFKLNAVNYIQNNIDTIISILRENKFMDIGLNLTDKAYVAMQLQEVHSLALADLYEEMSGFTDVTAIQLACLFSCFTNISMQDDQKLQFPVCIDQKLKEMAESIKKYINKYYYIESDNQLDTGTDYTLHYELIDYIKEWCEASDEIECKNIIIKIKNEKELFLGEFVKAILKINNIAAEFEKICESLQNINLLQKVKVIPELTLKYVVTNQSLYI